MKDAISLRLSGVSKTFGAVTALHPLDIDVRPGEMLALLGPSGCGKTTTLRMIAGFDTPDTGSVWFGSDDVTEREPNERSIGMVFQNYSLFPHLTIGENVAYGLKVRGVKTSERRERVAAMLDMVRLSGFESRHIHQLSGGQQQRVALARALVTDPAVLLLDEPLGALDKNLRERMQFELREIQRRLNITAVIVTHDQEEALTMSDRIAVMAEGRVIQIGTPMDIYATPCNQFVSEFMGTANIFDGVVTAMTKPGVWSVGFEFSPDSTQEIALNEPLSAGQRVRFAVRPERLLISENGTGIRASIRDIVFRGSYFAYELDLDGLSDAPAFAYSQLPLAVERHANVNLNWRPESAVLLS